MTYTGCGLDMSQAWFDVELAFKKLEHRNHFSNDPAGFEALCEWASSLGVKRLHVCMEYTGRFHLALAHYLYGHGHRVSLISGFTFSRFEEGFMKRNTSDKSSSSGLLRFLKERKPALWEPVGPEYEELRELTRHRKSTVKRLASVKNQLHSGPISTFVRESLTGELSFLKMQVELIEARIKEHVASCERLQQEVSVLTSMCGIRFDSAAAILGEIGDWRRFASSRSLEVYAGYLPSFSQSGIRRSKNGRAWMWGNRHLRNALHPCVLCACKHLPELKAFGDKLRARGKGQEVFKAQKRKTLSLVYGMLKSLEPFDPSRGFRS